MKYVIKQRGVRYAKEVEAFPDFQNLLFLGRYIRLDCEGKFESLQYAFYFKDHTTYTVDLPDVRDWQPFNAMLDKKFKAAGVKPKVAKGTIQAYAGEIPEELKEED